MHCCMPRPQFARETGGCNAMAAEDDFVLPVRKSGRKKKPSVKQRLLDDSGDSDGEGRAVIAAVRILMM